MTSTRHSRNRFRSVASIVLPVLSLAIPGAGLARADDHSGRVDVTIPGVGGLNVQWGEPQPINAPYVVQTRGPVHEAFAEPVTYDPAPDFVIPRPPPDPLDEVPPQIYPVSNAQVTWIPGYWAWDDDRDNFVWVSGIWRNIPPGRQFVPGYWLELANGYQWVPGLWISDEAQTVQYLPQPPESLERGPSSEPPEPNAVWVPGAWIWHDVEYLWRPGYWTRPQEGWVWVPDHYVWAPSGYVFVNGYWDYDLAHRGLLFAPIYVSTPVAAAPRFVYRPSVVVNAGVLVSDLFARPRYCHYYFGDYYERQYFQSGIYPAYSFYDSDVGYDPIFSNYVAVQHVPRAEVLQRFRNDYRYLRDNPRVRPPRTYTDFERLSRRRDLDPHLASRANLVQPLRQLSEQPQPNQPFRFERVEPDRLSRYQDTIAQTRQYQQERQRLERQNLREAPSGQPLAPGVSRERQVDISRQRTAVPTPGRVERTVPPSEQPATPGAAPPRVTRPPAEQPAPTPGRTPERVTPPPQPAPAPQQPAVKPPPAPQAPPTIRRDQLPEETQRQLRPGATPRAEPQPAPGKPGTEARPTTPVRPGQARSPISVERKGGNPVQLPLNRSPLGGRSPATQPQAGAPHGAPPTQGRQVAPPAPKGAQPEQKGKPQQPVRERRAPKED